MVTAKLGKHVESPNFMLTCSNIALNSSLISEKSTSMSTLITLLQILTANKAYYLKTKLGSTETFLPRADNQIQTAKNLKNSESSTTVGNRGTATTCSEHNLRTGPMHWTIDWTARNVNVLGL